jgi:hypothetical protein
MAGADGVELDFAGVTAALGTGVSVSNLTGSFAVMGGATGGVKGSLSGTPDVNVPGLVYSGSQLALSIDTTNSQETFDINGDVSALTIAGQPLVASQQQGSTTFDFLVDAASKQVKLQVTGVSANVSTFAGVTNLTGSFTIASDGVSGTVTGDTSLNVAGLTYAGQLGLTIDTTAGQSLFELSGDASQLTIAGQSFTDPSGASFDILVNGNEVDLKFSGVTASLSSFASVTGISGDFQITADGVQGTLSGSPQVSITGFDYSGTLSLHVDTTGGQHVFDLAGSIADLTILGQSFTGSQGATFDLSTDGTNVHVTFAGIGASLASFVSVSDITGDFTVTGGADGGVKGSLNGTPDVTLPGFTYNGQLGLAIDTTGGNKVFELTGDVGALSIAGQSLTSSAGASFDFQVDSGQLNLKLTNAAIDLGPAGSPVVSVSDINGEFQASSAGLSGSIGAHLAIAVNDAQSNPIVSLSGGIELGFSADVLEVDTPEADPLTATVYANGQQLLSLEGGFDFTIGSATSSAPGFKLKSFSLSAGGFTLSNAGLSQPNALMADQVAMPMDTPATDEKKLGPLSFQNLQPQLNHFDFTGGTLSFDLGLTADGASLDFGSGDGSGNNPGGVHASFSQAQGSTDPALSGSFGLSVNVSPSFSVSANKFNFTAQQFDFSVDNAVTGTFTGVQIGYDPTAGSSQTLVSLNSGSVTIPKLDNLTFGIQPGTDGTPGLVVTGQGFHFANLSVKVTADYTIGPVTFSNPSVTLSNFGVTYAPGNVGADFGNSSITVGADSVSVTAGSFSSTGTNLQATLQFANGAPSDFTFSADQLEFKFGSLLTVTATTLTLDPTATGSNPLISTESVSASLDIPKTGLDLTGTVGNFEVLADGTFSQVGGKPFTVDLSLVASSSNSAAGDLNWPSLFPLQISQFDLTWADLKDDPTNFTIDLSAAIHTTIAGMTLDASVTNAVIDVQKLLDGEFPVTQLDSITGSVSGTLFGAGVTATVAGGVVQVDSDGLRIPSGNPDNVTVDKTVLYMGMTGGLTLPGIGTVGVEFGFSQLGPLSVYVYAQSEEGILLDPDTGLALGGLRGGIMFNASPLPTINDARDLNLSVFGPPNKLTPEQWNEQMQQQVINQLGGGAGLIFAIPSTLGDLTDSTTTIPSDLNDAFNANNYPLLDVSTIQNTQSGDWIITSGTQQYLVETRQQGGGYNVSQLITSLPSNLLPTAAGAVPSNLVNAFGKLGVTLDGSATVAPDANGPAGRWAISDNGVTYVLQSVGSLVAVTGGAGSVQQMNSVLRIDAGATLFDEYASEDAIKGDVDVTILTNGQFLASGALTFGDSLTIDSKIYADFRALTGGGQQTGGKISVSMLTDIPNPKDPTQQLLEIYVTVGITFLDGQGNPILDPAHDAGSAAAVEVDLSGGAELNAFNEQNVQLQGTVDLKFSSSTFSMNLTDATLSVGGLISGQIAQASGALTVDLSNGPQVYGALQVNVSSSNLPELAQAGISFGGDAFVRVNTTSQDLALPLNVHDANGQQQTVTVSLPHDAAGLFIYGHMTFAQAGVTADMSGAFGIDYSTETGLEAFLAATLQLEEANKPVFGFDAVGVLVVQNNGNFALFGEMDRSASLTEGDLSFNGSVNLQIDANTSGQDVTYVVPQELQAEIDSDPSLSSLLSRFASDGTPNGAGGIAITIPGGAPPVDPNQPAPHTGDPYVVVRGTANLNLLNQFTVNGQMYIEVTDNQFDLTASGSLQVPDLGSVNVDGTVQITSAGVAAALTASRQVGTTLGSGDGLDISGAFSVVLNTTDQFQTITVPTNDGGFTQLSNIDPHSVRIHVDGSVDFVGFAKGTGSADIMYDQNALSLDAHLDFSLADAVNFHADAAAVIYAGGVAVNVSDISLNAGFDVGGIFTVTATGTGTLTINTGDQWYPVDGVSIAPDSFHLDVSTSVDLLNALTLSGEIIIDASNGGWSVTVPQDNALSLDFFGIGTLDAYGSFNSNGAFNLTFDGSVFLGNPKYFALGGTGTVSVGNDPGNTGVPTGLTLSGSGSGGVYVANKQIVGGDVSFDYDSGSGDINATVGYTFFGHHSFTIYVGSLKEAPSIFLGGDLNAPTTFSGGVLYLNMGDARAQYRGFDAGQVDENVGIGGGDVGANGQDITITMMGQTQTFHNVTEVVVDGGTGDDLMQVDSTVQVPVVLDGGTGDNTLTTDSPVGDTLSASGGDNTIEGGPGNDTINAGTGTFDISDGGGADAITLTPTGSSGSSYSVTGSGASTLFVDPTGGGISYVLNSDGSGDGSVSLNAGAAGSESLSFSGMGGLIVNATGSDNTFLVRATLPPTTLNTGSAATVNVGGAALGSGGTLANIVGTLQVNGSAATLNVDDSGGAAGLTGYLGGASLAGLSPAPIDFQGVSSVNVALGAGQTLNVTGTLPGAPVVIDAAAGGDTINVSGNSSAVTIKTGAGDDTINIEATGASLAIDTGSGGQDTINVGSNAPASNGTLNAILGGVTIAGTGADTLNVDDTGSTAGQNGTLTPTNLTGLGMGAAGITYSGLANLNLNLGSGGNTLTIHDIAPATHTTIDGGSSANDTVNADFAADFNGRLDLTSFEHGAVNVTGNFNGVLNDTAPGQLESVTIGGSLTTTGALKAGAINDLTIGGNLAGTVNVAGTLADAEVDGDVSGRVNETGTIDQLTIGGSLTPAGTIAAVNATPASGNLNTLSIGGDLAGKITVSGTLASLSVGGDQSGSVGETGTINQATIGGSLTSTGTIRAVNAAPALGNINDLAIGGDLAGTVLVSGTLTDLLVGGDMPGSVTESGTTDQLQIGSSLTSTGRITAGGINNLSIGKDLAGNVNVAGTLANAGVGGDVSGNVSETGTIDQFTIGGSLTPTGTITAVNAGAPTNGNIELLSVGGNLAGTVTASGAITDYTVGGNQSGSVVETGTIDQATINGSLTSTGLIKAVNATPSLGNINALTIGQDLAGTVIASGTLGTLTIVNGSMTPTANVTVGMLDSFNLGPDHLSVGQNLAGNLTVTGALGSVRVAGGTPGLITAGHIGTIAVYGGYGPDVARVIENGIQRRVELATSANPYPLPDPTVTVTGPYVNVQYFYESGALANPQLTARIANGVSSSKDQYDLSLVTHNDVAKFNLARLDAAGVAGVRNVDVEGDLLWAVTPQAAGFFKLANGAIDPTPAGIRLPQDNMAGVGIRDFAPDGEVQARSIQAIAFGSHAEGLWTEPGANANANDAAELLASGTAIVQANDTFRVPFADQPQYHVGLFVATDAHGGHFDNDSINLAVEGVASPNATGTGNVITPGNVARGADTALVTVTPTYDRSGRPQDAVVQSIAIRGDGATIQTGQYVASGITSTGPLGDLTLSSGQGISNITAPSIFGSILTNGQITGTIQTTGLRTDPITSVVTSVPADLGNVYMVPSGRSWVVTSTVIQSNGGLPGRIISRGNLISAITANGGISGTIAAQGNLGTYATVAGVTTRQGGVLSNGTFSGELIVLGDAIGDVTLHGGLQGGDVAVKGSIVGNMLVDGGLDRSSAIVAGGAIGSATNGTALTVHGHNAGIIAAKAAIRFAGGSPGGWVFNNAAGTSSAAAIDALFTNGGQPLAFDVNSGDLQGLNLILQDLLRLQVAGNATLTGPVA